MTHIVHCQVTKYDKDGKPYKVLQAFEIVNGMRRPTSTPTKDSLKSPPVKEKFK